LAATVSKEIKSLIRDISDSLPDFPSLKPLKTLHDLIACNNELVNVQDRATVTETCSKLFHQMIKTKDIDLLDPVLSLVTITWTRSLLNTDITLDIVSLVVRVFCLKDVRVFVTEEMIKTMFRMMSLIVSNPDHCHSLCRQSENCTLLSILAIAQSCCRSGISDELKHVVCSSLVSWVQLSQSVPNKPYWTNNECSWCTSELIRCIVHLLHTQVHRVSVNFESDESLMAVIKRGVTVLDKLQTNLESQECGEWSKVFDVAANAQRKYIWSVEKLRNVDMGLKMSIMLQGLSMDVTNSSQEQIKSNGDH